MIIFNGITHIVLAIAIYLSIFEFNIYALVLVAIGAILPDIDHVRSMLGKYNIFASLMKHRGFMHTLPALLLILLLFKVLNINNYYAIMFGYLTHLLADSLTPSGIMWAYPFSNKHYTLNKNINSRALEAIVFGISLLYLFTEYKLPK